MTDLESEKAGKAVPSAAELAESDEHCTVETFTLTVILCSHLQLYYPHYQFYCCGVKIVEFD